MDQEYSTWLENLKAGDTVALSSGMGYREDFILDKVVRRTKTMIILENQGRFDKHGYRVGASSWHRTSIYPVTDEVKNKMRASRLRSKIYDYAGALQDAARSDRKTSLESLEQIYKVLSECDVIKAIRDQHAERQNKR